jgi:adhesin/invasin
LNVISSTVPSTMTLVAVPGTLPVAQSATLTATVWDLYGQPMPGQAVNFSTTDLLGLGGLIPSSGTTVLGGQATAVISSTQPGVKRVTATAGSQSATTPVTFTAASNQPYTVTLTVVPGTPLITQTAQLLATVTDQNGNRLSGQVITFSSPSDFGTLLFSAIVPLTGTTDVNGQVTATVS